MIGQLHSLKERIAMAWHYDAHRQCPTTLTDTWRLLVRQGRTKHTWRAAVTPLRGGVARIAPAVFTSSTAAQAWCLAAVSQERREATIGS